MNNDEKKPKKIVSEKSKKNLKPFIKGQIGNPLGYHAQDPIKREFKKINNEFVNEIIHIAMNGKRGDLDKIIDDDDVSEIKRGIARAVRDACSSGDWTKMEHILSRIIGKVPDKIELNTPVDYSLLVKYAKSDVPSGS